MARHADHAGTAALGHAEVSVGRSAHPQNRRDGGKCFDVIEQCRRLKRPGNGRKRRPNPRHAALAFERFQQRRFLTALISARAGMRVEVELKLGAANVLAQIPVLVGFGDRLIHNGDQVVVLATDVDPTLLRAHRNRTEQNALNQLMGIVLNQQPVFAGAGFGFIGIDDNVLRLFGRPRNKTPLQPGREARAAAAPQVRSFHFVDDVVGGHHQRLAQRFVAVVGDIGIDRRGILQPKPEGDNARF